MTSSPTPPPSASPSLLDRLRALFAGSSDGRLGSTVTATRAVELVREGASLVDVREKAEWRSGHAPQAVHIPLADVEKGARRLSKDRPVVVMCASGMRSRTGAKQLRALGFDATSVSGGIGAWQRAGGAVRR
ncbi:rhodanese-like domain-containing protein [Georgenia sp. EYE_87]|uniref:rhodanese-like domain-containing protein n=1 Tax=Georgenia sp. EYE_87 TaxID=2853448 RepID=UPI002003C3B3|nr:rhodanese-like domain-containing protein [Georgenia sp. EYE_87]MCK6212516.1 rhodanese-like domain-containing protein [Georgenia sp. EYE_87]